MKYPSRLQSKSESLKSQLIAHLNIRQYKINIFINGNLAGAVREAARFADRSELQRNLLYLPE
jgi:hypothetical protein